MSLLASLPHQTEVGPEAQLVHGPPRCLHTLLAWSFPFLETHTMHAPSIVCSSLPTTATFLLPKSQNRSPNKNPRCCRGLRSCRKLSAARDNLGRKEQTAALRLLFSSSQGIQPQMTVAELHRLPAKAQS